MFYPFRITYLYLNNPFSVQKVMGLIFCILSWAILFPTELCLRCCAGSLAPTVTRATQLLSQFSNLSGCMRRSLWSTRLYLLWKRVLNFSFATQKGLAQFNSATLPFFFNLLQGCLRWPLVRSYTRAIENAGVTHRLLRILELRTDYWEYRSYAQNIGFHNHRRLENDLSWMKNNPQNELGASK